MSSARATADVILRIADAFDRSLPSATELECNPLAVGTEGIYVLDAFCNAPIGKKGSSMRFRQLGQNGPTISALGYGTWQAGGTDWRELPRETVINAIRSALDAGANWLDTAELYGHGRAEELVAEAVSDRTGADKPLIFTKVAPSGYGSGLDRDGIRRAAEASLSQLGVERIDLYQVHWFEESGAVDTGPSPISVETSWSAMAELVQDGLVSHIGVSNVDRATVERCGALHEVTSVQNEFSMLCRGDVDDCYRGSRSKESATFAIRR